MVESASVEGDQAGVDIDNSMQKPKLYRVLDRNIDNVK